MAQYTACVLPVSVPWQCDALCCAMACDDVAVSVLASGRACAGYACCLAVFVASAYAQILNLCLSRSLMVLSWQVSAGWAMQVERLAATVVCLHRSVLWLWGLVHARPAVV
jgi:hypothetical protein